MRCERARVSVRFEISVACCAQPRKRGRACRPLPMNKPLPRFWEARSADGPSRAPSGRRWVVCGAAGPRTSRTSGAGHRRQSLELPQTVPPAHRRPRVCQRDQGRGGSRRRRGVPRVCERVGSPRIFGRSARLAEQVRTGARSGVHLAGDLQDLRDHHTRQWRPNGPAVARLRPSSPRLGLLQLRGYGEPVPRGSARHARAVHRPRRREPVEAPRRARGRRAQLPVLCRPVGQNEVVHRGRHAEHGLARRGRVGH